MAVRSQIEPVPLGPGVFDIVFYNLENSLFLTTSRHPMIDNQREDDRESFLGLQPLPSSNLNFSFCPLWLAVVFPLISE
jgi:hypothetical protein